MKEHRCSNRLTKKSVMLRLKITCLILFHWKIECMPYLVKYLAPICGIFEFGHFVKQTDSRNNRDRREQRQIDRVYMWNDFFLIFFSSCCFVSFLVDFNTIKPYLNIGRERDEKHKRVSIFGKFTKSTELNVNKCGMRLRWS